MSTPARGHRPPQGTPVLTRAFGLLSTFGPDHRAQSLADLTRRGGLPRSTTLRLARQLVGCGALERRDDGAYVIGVRLLEVASLAPRGHGLRETAMPFMEDLFHITRGHVLLAVLDGEEAVLVERLSAHEADPVLYRVGGRMPLHTTGVGLVLLAHASPAMAERFPEPESLRRTLAEIRRGGFATNSLTTPWPRTSVAAPVFAGGDRVVAALSIVAPTDAADPRTLVPTVRAAARAISRHLAMTRG